MPKPDYRNCIVNLVSSITSALGGGESIYEPLAAFNGLKSSEKPLVLVIIDGLGDVFLQNYPHSFLCQHRQGRLTSVFPPTTASAVTSFFTGVGPQQHGITGWHTYFKELGAVATVLPFIPRYGGACLSGAGVSPAQLVDHGSLIDDLDVPCQVIMPQYLVDSEYSRTLSGRAGRHGFADLAGMFACIDRLVMPGQKELVVAYWPELDSLAHEHGMASKVAADHFQEIDRSCRENLPHLASRGASVIVTADHGLIDTCRDHTILLRDHPELAACLTLPLCGEPRCAYCYVRSDRREDFEAYVSKNLSHAFDLCKSSELIKGGYFGKGTPSPHLPARTGEYVLLAKEDYVIKDRLLSEKPFRQIGVHGGLSEAELFVPLIVLEEHL